ncbi:MULTISPECIES: hypothetical protein [Actinomadura]|uniref:Uncharacterized protein n=1 Tax=Actinomadura yumaensis TaxID=111807 RepID=A0ABW2CG79_9ACTN|nr:hypothetical protein [Actinomadura sp. J1-007]
MTSPPKYQCSPIHAKPSVIASSPLRRLRAHGTEPRGVSTRRAIGLHPLLLALDSNQAATCWGMMR